MTKSELQKRLSAETLYDCGIEPETGYDTVCACDMMSELLAIMNDGVLQRFRVGGANGVATRHMARQNAEIVATASKAARPINLRTAPISRVPR